MGIDMKTKIRLSLKPEDSENLTDLIRGVKTVDVAVFFEELKSGHIRVSMRSKMLILLTSVKYVPISEVGATPWHPGLNQRVNCWRL